MLLDGTWSGMPRATKYVVLSQCCAIALSLSALAVLSRCSRSALAVPQETATESWSGWCYTTFLAPVRCFSPVERAATVDDLHIILTLTLRRRVVWLSFLLLAELTFYLVKLQASRAKPNRPTPRADSLRFVSVER